MDYGKDAFMRVNELTDRLSSFRPSAANVVCGLTSGVVAEYVGAAAVVFATVTSDGDGETEVSFGGKKVCSVRAGGTYAAAFAVGSGGKISLEPTDGVSVRSVVLSAYGRVTALKAAQ